MLQAYTQGRWFPTLLLNEAGVIVGRANLKDIDLQAGAAELGYRVGQDQVGSAVATAAVSQMKALARQQLGLRRLQAVVSPPNLASSQVLEKCGFERAPPAAGEAQQHSDTPLFAYQCMLD